MSKKEPTAEELVAIVDKATKEFVGQFNELESAIGMLFAGRKLGWKVLYLIHNKRTIEKYEKVLDIKVREFFPEVGPLASKSVAWTLVQAVGNFWKAVKGEIQGIRTAEITKG